MNIEINTEELLNEIVKNSDASVLKNKKDITDKEIENDTSTIQKMITSDFIDDKYYYCEEEDLLDELDNEFSSSIKKRGRNYYNFGNVILCSKNKNKYYAKVCGTDTKPYVVNIEIKEDEIKYDCTCPCDFPCKHEYAVLMAIDNQEYETIELKPEIKEKKNSLQNILKLIPADEIKNYLLSPMGADYVCFEMGAFENYFRKYYPNQDYEYYYNNLYNALALEDEYDEIMNVYISKIRQYISNKEFNESFKILKSIINAYGDIDKINFDNNIIQQFPTLGMLLRIIGRKCSEDIRKNINNWITDLKKKNYYNSLYLEDIVLMINFEESI